MGVDICGNPREVVNEVLKEVYVDEEIVKEIVGVLLTIKCSNYLKERLRGWGIQGWRPPRGILLYGPPGTGKTRLMRTIAEKVLRSGNTKCYVEVSGPQIISSYYGESEKNLRKVFKKARDLSKNCGVAAVLIDELDAIAPKREAVAGELEQRLVSQLLTLMDGLQSEEGSERVVVIATTNQIWRVDEALRRPGRFDMEFEIGLPDLKARKEILKIHLRPILGLVKEEDVESIVSEAARISEGFSGADLMYAVRELMMKLIKGVLFGTGSKGVELRELIDILKRTTPSIARSIIARKLTDIIKLDSARSSKVKSVAEILSEVLREGWSARECPVPLVLLDVPKLLGHYASMTRPELVIYEALNQALKAVGVDPDNFWVVEASIHRMLSKWVGETERNLRSVFARFIKLGNACLVLKGIESISTSENLIGVVNEVMECVNDLINRCSSREGPVKAVIATCTRCEEVAPEIRNLFIEVPRSMSSLSR